MSTTTTRVPPHPRPVQPPPTPVARAAPKPTQFVAVEPPARAQIRERAYFYYVARGGQPGAPEEDWLRAERELMAEAIARASGK